MSLKIMVQYKDLPVVYDVTKQEDDVYQLRLHGKKGNNGEDYLPEKINIRKKGKIWVSDLENYHELVDTLMLEILQFKEEGEQKPQG